MGKSYNPDYNADELFLKMDGHKIYQYALRTVPGVVKECLEKAGLLLKNVSKVLIHQANEKMDEAILKRLYKLYDTINIPPKIMPMTISWLGNSSSATIPTLLDLLMKNKIDGYSLSRNENIVFTSVGAGMNINAVVYRFG